MSLQERYIVCGDGKRAWANRYVFLKAAERAARDLTATSLAHSYTPERATIFHVHPEAEFLSKGCTSVVPR